MGPTNNIYIQVDFNSIQATQNVYTLNQAITNIGPAAQKSSAQTTTALTSMNSSVQQATRAFSELSAALVGLGIGRMITDMIQVGSEINRSQTFMIAFTGSVEKATKMYAQLHAVAVQGIFGLKDIEQAGRALLAFGMAAEDVPAAVKIITDQVTAMGGSMENVTAIVRILGRVFDKDFVGAMDLLRVLPQNGVKIMDALRESIGKVLGVTKASTEEVRAYLKTGALDPAETINIMLRAMEKGSKDAGLRVHDFAKDMKNLGIAFDDAKKQIMSEAGFGKAFDNLAEEIRKMLEPLAALFEWLMKLDDPTKQMIVNFGAAAAAALALSAALTIIKTISGPVITAITLIGKALLFAFANPELLLVMGTITAFIYAFTQTFPEEAKNLEAKGMKFIGDLVGKLKAKASDLMKESGLFPDTAVDPLSQGTGKPLVETAGNLQAVQKQVDEWSSAASRALLTALGAPADAIAIKYKELFEKLEAKMKELAIGPDAPGVGAHADALRNQLRAAQKLEADAKVFEKEKAQINELAKLDEERVKGSYEAQIAYIEALDAKDLKGKVAAIDKITELRIASADKVAAVQDDALQQVFDDQKALYDELAKQGVDVTQAVADAQKEMENKKALNDAKAFDEGQKYRMEGWKKANDAIIEDQKRVFDAFKSEFDQIFDAITSKHPGKAIADVFKNLALGEVKNIFSTQLASLSTAAAGYGVPSPEITKGGGIISQLIQHGMPPRPVPLPMPELYNPARAKSGLSFDDKDGANRFASSTDIYNTATVRFALAVAQFTSGGASGKGYAERTTDGATPEQTAMLAEIRRRESGGAYSAQNATTSASGAYQIIDQTWKEAAQGTGLGAQYAHAKDAPQAIQDANALWLLQHRGTKPWAASGPYNYTAGGTGGTGGADFSTTVYATAPPVSTSTGYTRVPSAGPGYEGGSSPTGFGGGGSSSLVPPGMSLDQMMALPMISRMSQGLPGLFGKIGMGGGINVSSLSQQGNALVSNWKKMLGFGPAPGTGSADAPDTGGTFSFKGLAGSPLAKAGAGIAGGMLAQYGLLGPAEGTGTGILMGTLGGAGVGFSMGGPLGAAIGAAAGLGIGVGEMLAGVESPQHQAKRLANSLYHIAINNATADQIVSLANSSYGGSVSRAMRSPEVRHMLGLFAAGTGQSMAQGFNEPHGASLVESGGSLQQQQTYQYGQGYVQSSSLPTYGGGSPSVLGAPGGLSLSLNIGGQDAAKFLAGNVVSPSVVQTQFAAAMNGSNGRVAQALMMSEPGSIAS